MSESDTTSSSASSSDDVCFCNLMQRGGYPCGKTNKLVEVEGGHRCNKHRNSVQRIKCSFPHCQMWTRSKLGYCSSHNRCDPADFELECILGEDAPKICDHISCKGVKCTADAMTGISRCYHHLQCPGRAKCLAPGCSVFTSSMYTLCSRHSRSLSKYSIARTIANTFAEHGRIPYIDSMLSINRNRANNNHTEEELTYLVRSCLIKHHPKIDPMTFSCDPDRPLLESLVPKRIQSGATIAGKPITRRVRKWICNSQVINGKAIVAVDTPVVKDDGEPSPITPGSPNTELVDEIIVVGMEQVVL